MGPSGGNDEMKIRSGMLATKFCFSELHYWTSYMEAPLRALRVLGGRKEGVNSSRMRDAIAETRQRERGI